MPTPHPDKETREEWMARCVPFVLDEGTAQDSDQAVAMCSQMWRDASKEAIMMNRAYSILTVKSVDEEQRIIRGTATTPEPDRVGDIVNPLGVKFKNPMPLLWQHDTRKPVGTVRFDKPTKDGIEFEAKLARPVTSQALIERVEEAWESLKLKLVKGVSIGFRAIKYAFMDDGGIDFQETEVMELSLVTIPANAGATITMIKSVDAPLLAASGIAIDRPKHPGVTGKEGKSFKRKEEIKVAKTIGEQIAAFETTLAAKVAQMSALMEKCGEDMSTLDDADSEAHDTLMQEVDKINKHLVRLREQEKINKLAAKPVIAKDEEKEVAREVREQANGSGIIRATGVKANVPKGTSIVRYAMALAAGKGDTMKSIQRAAQWHDQTPEVEEWLRHDIAAEMNGIATKAAVGAGTTTDATWAAPLVSYTTMASEFIDLLRPATIIGRIGGLRRVPFNIQMPRTTSGTTAGWVGENAPKPVSQMAFDTVTLRWAKAAGIVVMTDELVRFSNPAAEAVVRQDLIDTIVQFLDRQFVDPSVAEVTNVSPASITNGVSAITPTGTTASAFRADIKTLFNTLFTNNLSAAGGVWIMTQQQALSLGIMQNSLGQPVFPTLGATGGTLLGYPVITSENIPASTGSPVEGYPIIFAIAPEIMLADDGTVVLDASNQASVQMDTAPDSPPTASTNMVSLWQMNMTGIRAERWINWKKRRSTVVQYITSAHYSE